jgi:formylglycine-generating enzyme required for sulfatase activity
MPAKIRSSWPGAFFRINGAIFFVICAVLGLLSGATVLGLLGVILLLTRGDSIGSPNPIVPLLFIFALLIATFCPPLALLYLRARLRSDEATPLKIEPIMGEADAASDEANVSKSNEVFEFDFSSVSLAQGKALPVRKGMPILRFAFVGLLVLLLVGGGLAYYLNAKQKNGADADWQVAVSEASPAGYRAFLQLWPNSRYASEAKRRLQVISMSTDEGAWKVALSEKSKQAYEQYLKQFPTGLHAAEASSELQALAAAKPLSDDDEHQLKPLNTFRECIDCPVMVVIPSGQFSMGSSADEIAEHKANANEGPQHSVTVRRSFAIGKYEVTFAEWDACVTDGGCRGYRVGDEGWGRGARPVINVSWDDAKLFARWISQKTGKIYRLASEAEWEYAARAGSTARFFFGNDSKSLCKYANVADESGSKNVRGPSGYSSWQLCDDGYPNTAPVGSFEANRFGLFDMLGNVDEWVEDIWHETYDGGPADGSAWLSGGDTQFRIARGGSYFNLEDGVRSAVRFKFGAGSQGNLVGFRIARALAE